MDGWNNVTASEPCEICGADRWCSRSDDRSALNCRRQSTSDKYGAGKPHTASDGNQFWTFFTAPKQESSNNFVPSLSPSPCKADPDTLHKIYSSVLDRLDYSHPAVQKELIRRGLSNAQNHLLQQHGYRWLPKSGRSRIARAIIKEHGEQAVAGTPGFVIRHGKQDDQPYWTISGYEGLLVPIRDIQGRIVALKVRPAIVRGGKYYYLTSKNKKKNDQGSSPGSPVHVPVSNVSRETVRVTEGELKADIATMFSGVLTIGLPGLGWKKAQSALEQLGAKSVLVSLDRDWRTNPAVLNAVVNLLDNLRSQEFQVAWEIWNPEDGKGVDDALTAGKSVQRIEDEGEIYRLLQEQASSIQVKTPAERTQSGSGAEDEGPTLMEVAESFLDSHFKHDDRPTLAYHRKTFSKYVGTHYRTVDDEDLKCHLTSHIDIEMGNMSMGRLSTVYQCLKSKTLVSSDIEPSSWIESTQRTGQFIALQNGILDLTRLLNGDPNPLSPHSPNWFSPVCLPYQFNPTAECPQWFNVLLSSLDGDLELTNLLQEWFGYLLIRGTHQQKFAILYGEGGTGKSTTCAALTAMLGEQNVSSVSLEDLGSRFQLHRTLGKLANISAETEEVNKVAEGRLKALTSGDPVSFEEKNKPIFDATPTARLIFAMNNLPRFTDRSSGLWRRLILIPFNRVIPESERVPGMDKAAWWIAQGELPGIFNWAIEGLRRLQRNGFTNSERCQGLIESYRRESNPARSFLLKNYREEQHGCVVTRDVYQTYRSECASSGTQPLHEANFGREVRRTFSSAIAKRKRIHGMLTHCYEGICEGPSEIESQEEILN